MSGFSGYADANNVKKTDIVNNLTSTATDAPLSAAQGKMLNEEKVASIYFDSADTTWGKVYAKLITIPVNKCADISIHQNALPILTDGGTVTEATARGIVCRTSTSIYDFFVSRASGQYIITWRITDATSTSRTTGSLFWFSSTVDSVIANLSANVTANTTYVNTGSSVEMTVSKQANVVAVKFTFTVKGTPAAGASFFSGFPKAQASAYQFVAMNTTTKKPIMMAISATDGTLCNWYGNDALAAGDVIRGGATYVCQA